MPYTTTFHGFIENTTDALLIVEACRSGLLPTVNRRLIERERHSIKSGTIIVFNETESGIKRWTDGFLWSPSRILGNFLVYRELENREHRKISHYSNTYIADETNRCLMQHRERSFVGSLTTANTTYNFKRMGLIKKTIRIMVNGNFLHIVNYYSKHDALNNLLVTPSASPELACLQISADLMPHLQGHQPATTLATNKKRSPSPDQQQTRPEYRASYSNATCNYMPAHSISSGTTRRLFDTNYYAKRSRPSQETLLSLSPPKILSSCGDTAILANRFNQFYNLSSMDMPSHSGSASNALDYTAAPHRTAFDNY